MAMYKGAASEAGRAMMIKKRRERDQEELEIKKRKLEKELKVNRIQNKFFVHYDAVEQQLKSSTIGLVTLNEMKAKQEVVVKEREKELAKKESEKEKKKRKELEAKQKEKKAQGDKIAKLSFAFQDDECEESDSDNNDEKPKILDNSNEKLPNDSSILDKIEKDSDKSLENSDISVKIEENLDKSDKNISKKPNFKMTKNPDVDTSFLPDKGREEEENKLREELRMEWEARQYAIKSQEIEITFSYWDGSGHRRSILMHKGNTIYQFLLKALELLRKEFNELKGVNADNLMYIKEDLIIPHHNTFYDFIVNKARGKSGPLFHFDVRDDVRLISDASVEKQESHAGKVVIRSWYERNKHIFPASRWEPYDPNKHYDKYSVNDKKKG